MKHAAKKSYSLGLIALLASCGANPSASLRMAKAITVAEAEQTRIDAGKMENLSIFSNDAIEQIRAQEETKNFAFSPLSYFQNVAAVYSLANEADQGALRLLGASSQKELLGALGDLSKRVFSIDSNPNHPQRIVTSNLVTDYAKAFGEEKIQALIAEGYFSYQNDPSKAKEDLDSFMKEVSGGNVASYPWSMPKEGELSFVSGLYADVSYPLAFPQTPLSRLPFDGQGEFDYFHGDQYASGIVVDEDYLAFRMGSLRFVKPVSGLADFFAQYSFDECFSNEDPQEYKITLSLPKLSLSSSLDLKGASEAMGLAKSDIRFGQASFAWDQLKQNSTLSFTNSGVRAYTATVSGLIPASAPIMDIALDSPFAFEILGRDDIVLYYGEIHSLS